MALQRSPAVRAAAVFGLSGAGFVLANLLFARALPPANYALVTLVVALVQIAMPLGPLGLDGVVVRHALAPGPDLVRRALATSALAGAVTAVAGAAFYGLSAAMLTLVLVASAAGGANVVAGAVHQGRQRFGAALALSQNSNGVLFLAGLVTLASGTTNPVVPVAMFAAGLVVSAVAGWRGLLAQPHEPAAGRLGRFAAEALALAGASAAGLITIQLERLLIPRALSLADLGTFAVVAAVAVSPFRMLHLGVGYTLQPGLRAAASPADRRRLLRREGVMMLALTLAAVAGVLLLTRPVLRVAVGDRYVISGALVLAAALTGVLRVTAAFADAAVRATGTAPDLARYNALSWIALAAAVAGALLGARYGLVGLMYGASAGWLGITLAGAALSAPHFRNHRA